jgi:hypothetical protein
LAEFDYSDPEQGGIKMLDINELRRLAQAATPGPWILLPVGDKSKCFAVADINLLSVLTVVDECGTSFGAVYLDGDAKFIAAANPAAVSELLDRLEAAEKERDALRAKIEAMEQQEPVAWLHESRRDSDVVTSAVKHVWGKVAVGSLAAYSIPLYLAPGAKGEEK